MRDALGELGFYTLAGSLRISRATANCRVLDQLDAGATDVILHGATPSELEPVLDAYRTVRPARVAHSTANPGAPRG